MKPLKDLFNDYSDGLISKRALKKSLINIIKAKKDRKNIEKEVMAIKVIGKQGKDESVLNTVHE